MIAGKKMDDRYSQIIVNRILSLCQQRNFTIYQLSVMSGVRYSTLDNLINRKTFNPKIKTLHKIASAFSLTLSEFFDDPELENFSFDESNEE